MNRLKKLRMIVLPLLVGLLTTSLVYLYIRQMETRSVFGKTVDVVVAVQNIPAKTLLQDNMLVIKQLPEELVNSNVLGSLEEAVHKITTVPLAEGEIVLKTKLAADIEKTALAYYVPDQKRAVTISVNEIIGVSGFVQPGDCVDVYSTFPASIAGKDKTILVLENLPVLAVVRDTDTSAEKAVKDISSFTSITLAATPEEAGRLIFAEENGHLRLTLRPALAQGTKGRLETNMDNLR
ncbi:MAG: Flp pilus assembly protein CpaB [bacterium]|jgi:pilus assembly protein CpaB